MCFAVVRTDGFPNTAQRHVCQKVNDLKHVQKVSLLRLILLFHSERLYHPPQTCCLTDLKQSCPEDLSWLRKVPCRDPRVFAGSIKKAGPEQLVHCCMMLIQFYHALSFGVVQVFLSGGARKEGGM